METLIKLLNEYEIWKTKDKISQNPKRSRRERSIWMLGGIFWTLMNERESRLSIISKSYWFIQRLVDNDKINVDEINCQNIPYYSYINEEWYVSFKPFWFYEQLLMLLAVQKNPIIFLTSILR